MTAFPDTSYLCALYCQQYNSDAAATYEKNRGGSLPVTTLLLFEFRQSTRLQVYLHSRDKTKGYSREQADAALAKLQANLASKGLELVSPDWADVHAIAEKLSSKYTIEHGIRTLDLLHVAIALHFGARDFLSFDSTQREIAKLEGLQIHPSLTCKAVQASKSFTISPATSVRR